MKSIQSDINQITGIKNHTFEDAQGYFMLLSDLMDFIWYLTDHYSVAHLLKFVENESHLQISNDIGNYTTLASWIFLALARYWSYMKA